MSLSNALINGKYLTLGPISRRTGGYFCFVSAGASCKNSKHRREETESLGCAPKQLLLGRGRAWQLTASAAQCSSLPT